MDEHSQMGQSGDWEAIRSVLGAYRSVEAHITEEQITAAWAAFDRLRVTPRAVPMNIRAMDLPEVQAALAMAQSEIERLKRERDEWEERYEWLLGEIGGTAPR